MDEKPKLDMKMADVNLDESPRLLRLGEVGYLWRSLELDKASPKDMAMVSVLRQPPFPRKLVENIKIAVKEIAKNLIINYKDGEELLVRWDIAGNPHMIYEVQAAHELLGVERKILDRQLEYAPIYTNAKRNEVFGIEFFAAKCDLESVVDNLAVFQDP